MSRRRPRFDDMHTLRVVCTHESKTYTLKTLKIAAGDLTSEAPRILAFALPGSRSDTTNVHWLIGWQPNRLADLTGEFGIPADYEVMVDETYTPALFEVGVGSDDPDDLLRDGFERTSGTNAIGWEYEYFKVRLQCPFCRRDVAIRPDRADDIVRSAVLAGVATLELTDIEGYLSGNSPNVGPVRVTSRH